MTGPSYPDPLLPRGDDDRASDQELDQAAGDVAELVQLLNEQVRQLLDQVVLANTPASPRTIVLSASRPMVSDDVSVEDVSRSVGLVNPSPVVVYLGLGGADAKPGQYAFSVPPEKALVLPVSAGRLTVGVDPADPELTDSAVVHLLRFPHVQPLSLG